MGDFLHNLGADPLYYAGAVVGAIAVLSFLVFLRGFISGAGYVYGNNGHAEHQEHAMARVTWGTFLLIAMLIIWEAIRFIMSWFGYVTMSTAIGLTALIILALWIAWSLIKGGGGGH